MSTDDLPVTVRLAHSTSPTFQCEARWAMAFDDARTRLDARLERETLFVLGVVDTTSIVMRSGMIVPRIVQVLAFHPRYMRTILETDVAGIVEAPLKITLIDRDGYVEVRCADPAVAYGRYGTLDDLGHELHQVVGRLLV